MLIAMETGCYKTLSHVHFHYFKQLTASRTISSQLEDFSRSPAD